ncbi:DUF6366 family protein [Sutcliffiella horikoshii]|uniref:DUF6366 family protein n=1 Tax=Sutcliffiella horikoshii TaxID=79883 RepID=UPI00384DF65F
MDKKLQKKKERKKQEERKKNPSGALGDGFNHAENGNSTDLVGGISWKVTVILIIVLIVGYVLYILIC